MKGYEKGGIKIQCTPEELAAGKVSILDGFVNSQNPEKQKFLDYIAQEAAVNHNCEKALIDAVYDSWSVNGVNTFEVMGFDQLKNHYI